MNAPEPLTREERADLTDGACEGYCTECTPRLRWEATVKDVEAQRDALRAALICTDYTPRRS